MRHNPQGMYTHTVLLAMLIDTFVGLVVAVKIIAILPQMCRINVDVTLHTMATKFHHNCHFSTWSKFAPSSLLLLRLIKSLALSLVYMCVCVCVCVIVSCLV